jgi:UrcA family protein
MNRMIVALAACLTLTATIANAATETRSKLVPRTGLDLSRPADAKRMLGRLERASVEICGSGAGSAWIVLAATKRSDCYRKALGSAVASARAPALYAAFAAAYPRETVSQTASANRGFD